MKENEITYWVAISGLKNWKSNRINKLLELIYTKSERNIEYLFNSDLNTLKEDFQFLNEELNAFSEIKKQLPNFTFTAEQLFNEGYSVIPIISPHYPSLLKHKLNYNAPPVIYAKGKADLLNREAIAIVGSREASQISLDFTDNVAKKFVAEKKVIVSGGAKGVDQQALESAIKNGGESILVLPQGILTFNYGFKKYYGYITSGKLLVISAFFPKSPWDVSLAMIRNQYIFGLAQEIYVAESGFSGGTWEGANLALKRKEKVFIRQALPNEKNANQLLIEKGGIPVDQYGNSPEVKTQVEQTDKIIVEPIAEYSKDDDLNNRLVTHLKDKICTVSQIIDDLNLNITRQKLQKIISKIPEIKIIDGKPKKYTCMKSDGSEQLNLFIKTEKEKLK